MLIKKLIKKLKHVTLYRVINLTIIFMEQKRNLNNKNYTVVKKHFIVMVLSMKLFFGYKNILTLTFNNIYLLS